MTTPSSLVRHAAALLAAALLAAATAATAALLPALPAQQPGPDTLRVGTWNLENFGRRRPPRSAEQVRELAAFIRDELRVDVLAVQEIDGAPALRTLVDALGTGWEFVIGTTGVIGDGAARISVGFLWNDARVELVQAEELMQLPREEHGLPIFHRVPVSAVFRARNGGLDFRAITVHMKANGYPQPKPTDADKRLLEAHHVLGYVRALLEDAGEDRDVMVLGDFNHAPGDPAHGVLTAHGFLRYLRTDGDPRTIVYQQFAGRPIDHVAITEDLAEEYVDGSRMVHADLRDPAARDAWRARYSDHAPVTVELDASADRDPDARFTPPLPGQLLGPGGMVAAGLAPAGARPDRATSRPTPRRRDDASAPVDPDATTAQPDPFRRGATVAVTYEIPGGQGFARGQLIQSLGGDWVRVHTDDGGAIALPRERVIRVELTR